MTHEDVSPEELALRAERDEQRQILESIPDWLRPPRHRPPLSKATSSRRGDALTDLAALQRPPLSGHRFASFR